MFCATCSSILAGDRSAKLDWETKEAIKAVASCASVPPRSEKALYIAFTSPILNRMPTEKVIAFRSFVEAVRLSTLSTCVLVVWTKILSKKGTRKWIPGTSSFVFFPSRTRTPCSHSAMVTHHLNGREAAWRKVEMSGAIMVTSPPSRCHRSTSVGRGRSTWL